MCILFFFKLSNVHGTRQNISDFITNNVRYCQILHSVDHIQIDEPLWTKSPPIYGHTDHFIVSMATTGTDYTEH